MEELPYNCYYDSCFKSYKTKYNLRRHINSNHLFIKEFACTVCSKTFASKQNLQGHERLHKQKTMMPLLEIPNLSSEIPHSKSENIRGFILSKLYKDPVITYSVNSNNGKTVLPILPPVSFERSNYKKNIKLPVIPILL